MVIVSRRFTITTKGVEIILVGDVRRLSNEDVNVFYNNDGDVLLAVLTTDIDSLYADYEISL